MIKDLMEEAGFEIRHDSKISQLKEIAYNVAGLKENSAEGSGLLGILRLIPSNRDIPTLQP
jgi:hypothetical protein